MKIIFYLLVLLLPTQFGRHFWPNFSFVQGIRVDYLSPTIYLTDILILLLFVNWALRSARKFSCSAKILCLPAPFWPILFVAVVLIGLFTSLGSWTGLYGLVKLLEFIFLGFYVAKTIKTKAEFKKIVFLLAAGLVFESLLAIWQFINQSSVGGIFWFLGERTFTSQTIGIAQAVINGTLILRPYGTFPHPNVLAGFLVVTMSLISLRLKVKSSKFDEVFFGAAITLGTATLFLTFSRVAIFLWLLISGFYLGKYFFKLKLFSGKFIMYYVLFIIFLIFVFQKVGFSTLEESFVRRGELTAAAIKMVKTRPIFGVGLSNFLVSLPFFQKTQSLILYLQPVHNIYLLVLAETGILGLAFFLWFLWGVLKNLNPQLLIPLLGILFLGLFDHYWLTLQQGQLFFTLILGLSWSRIKQ